MKNIILALFAFFGIVSLSACAPGALHYSPETDYGGAFDTVQVSVNEKDTEHWQRQYLGKLKTSLNQKLSQDFHIGDGGLVVHLRVVSADQGDRLGRWFWGPLAGSDSQGKIVVEAEFVNPQGETLGTATATGKIVVGFLGGSFDTAIDSAAKQIHAFAVKQFRG